MNVLDWQILLYMAVAFLLLLGVIRFFFIEKRRNYWKMLAGDPEDISPEGAKGRMKDGKLER